MIKFPVLYDKHLSFYCQRANKLAVINFIKNKHILNIVSPS